MMTPDGRTNNKWSTKGIYNSNWYMILLTLHCKAIRVRIFVLRQNKGPCNAWLMILPKPDLS